MCLGLHGTYLSIWEETIVRDHWNGERATFSSCRPSAELTIPPKELCGAGTLRKQLVNGVIVRSLTAFLIVPEHTLGPGVVDKIIAFSQIVGHCTATVDCKQTMFLYISIIC